MRVTPLAENGRAGAETGHEDRQHGCDGEGRGTEDEAQLAHPDGLVDERAQTGQKDQRGGSDHWGHILS
jgi:hypothetical protein